MTTIDAKIFLKYPDVKGVLGLNTFYSRDLVLEIIEAAIAATAQDAKRLDWLEKRGNVAIELCQYIGDDDIVFEITAFNDRSYEGATLREAIDAAIAAQQGDSNA